jgi:carbon-monoxide dehydrogenase large subunit
VQVTNPDTGSAFGMKSCRTQVFPDQPRDARSGKSRSMDDDRGGDAERQRQARSTPSSRSWRLTRNNKITATTGVARKCEIWVRTTASSGSIYPDAAVGRVLMGVYDVQTTWLQVDCPTNTCR